MSTPTPPSYAYEPPSPRRLQSIECFLTEYEEDARTFLAEEESQVIQLIDLWLDAISQPRDYDDDSVDITTTRLDHSSCSTLHGIWLPTRQFSDTLTATAQMPIATPLQDVKPASGLPSASKPLSDLHDRATEIKRLHTLHLQHMQRHRHNFLSTRPDRHGEGSMVSQADKEVLHGMENPEFA